MSLSIEEIELQLEEYPHDLSAWKEWLAYRRRFHLPQDRYKQYLREIECLSTDFLGYEWWIDNSKDLNILSGLCSGIKTLNLSSLDMESTEGITDFIAPNLNTLLITGPVNIELTRVYPRLYLYSCKIRFADTVDLSSIEDLILDDTQFEDKEVIYKAYNLKNLTVYRPPNFNIQLDLFKNLTYLWIASTDHQDYLKNMGSSDTLLAIDLRIPGSYLLENLVDNGWYPNLEHPIKGKNKR